MADKNNLDQPDNVAYLASAAAFVQGRRRRVDGDRLVKLA